MPATADRTATGFMDGRITTGEFLDRWLGEVAKHSVRPRTYQSSEQHARLYMKPALGRVRLVQLRPEHVQSLMSDMLDRGLAPASVNRVRAVLRTALEQAVDWHLVGVNVAAGKAVKPARTVKYRPLVLTSDQAKALVQSSTGDRLHALWALALGTGMRQGEVLALRWPGVDLERRTISVQRSLHWLPGGGWRLEPPKSESAVRTVSLPPSVVAVLHRHRAEQMRAALVAGAARDDSGLCSPRR